MTAAASDPLDAAVAIALASKTPTQIGRNPSACSRRTMMRPLDDRVEHQPLDPHLDLHRELPPRGTSPSAGPMATILTARSQVKTTAWRGSGGARREGRNGPRFRGAERNAAQAVGPRRRDPDADELPGPDPRRVEVDDPVGGRAPGPLCGGASAGRLDQDLLDPADEPGVGLELDLLLQGLELDQPLGLALEPARGRRASPRPFPGAPRRRTRTSGRTAPRAPG